MSDPMREAFEKYATGRGVDVGSPRDEKIYWSLEALAYWPIWQAAWRASREQALEEAAGQAAYIAELVEDGAGELVPGERLRQVESKIRKLKESK